MKAAEIKAHFPTEAALCATFIHDMNGVDGWTCYPETAGFDVLAAHTGGRQIGVEAKLALNAKVADQILPNDYAARYEREGPDHRVVIVPCLTDASAGIAKMLRMLGVAVWVPRLTDRRDGYVPEFDVDRELRFDAIAAEADPRFHGIAIGYTLFDWNPATRCQLPDMVPDVPAGVPAPVRMTPWKAGALRVLALLKLHGRITAKDIAAQGISPSMWTQGWLARAPERGFWLACDKTPWRLGEQHPTEFAAALAAMNTTPETANG